MCPQSKLKESASRIVVLGSLDVPAVHGGKVMFFFRTGSNPAS